MMAWPMILLAVGSVFSGGLLAMGGTLRHWLEPVVDLRREPHVLADVGRSPSSPSASSPSGSRVAVLLYGLRKIPDDGTRRGVGADRRPRAEISTAMPSTRRCSCDPVRN